MKNFSFKNLVGLALVTMVAAGCNRQTALVPPKIHFGLETCADCGMIISDAHYAAAVVWRTPDGSDQIAVFDDIGCLLNWRRHRSGVQILATWVKDVRTAAWLDASSASYVKSKRLQTPMGWGVVAGTTTNDFSTLLVQEPRLTWNQLLKTRGPDDYSASLDSQATRNN